MVTVVTGIMLAALIYGACDIHDTKPFPVDPESLITMCSPLLMLSAGILLVTLPVFGLLRFLSKLLTLPGISLSAPLYSELPSPVLFSSLQNTLSLRI